MNDPKAVSAPKYVLKCVECRWYSQVPNNGAEIGVCTYLTALHVNSLLLTEKSKNARAYWTFDDITACTHASPIVLED